MARSRRPHALWNLEPLEERLTLSATGAGPHVRVFSGETSANIAQILPRSSVVPTDSGDAPAFGGVPHVRVISDGAS